MKGHIWTDAEPNVDVLPSRSNLLSESAVLFAIVLITFSYRFYFIRFHDVLSADGTGYALSGEAFLKTWNPHSFGTLFPPIYPFLIGIFNLVLQDLEVAARTVSVFFSTLTIIPLYLITRQFYGKMAACCSTLLFITLPFIHQMSAVDITEPTYTFFAFVGMLFFWRAFSKKKYFVFSGLFFGLAYLARPEGFIVLFVLTIFFIGLEIYFSGAVNGMKKMMLATVMLWFGFMIAALPYMIYLREATGKWQLSGKTGYNSYAIRGLHGKTIEDQHLSLDSKGSAVGGGDETLLDLMRKEPELFWGNIRENLDKLPREFTSTFPLYLWPLVLIGVCAFSWRGERMGMLLSLISLCAPLALYVLYFIQARGFYAYIPILLIFAGGGSSKVEEWLQKVIFRPVAKVPATLLVMTVLATYFVYTEWPKPKPPYDFNQDGGRFDDKQIGLRLRALLPEKSRIMTRSGRIGFYSQRDFVLPPQASMNEIIVSAKRSNVSYLIATMQLLSMRPQLEILYTPLANPGARFVPPLGLELVYLGREPGGLPYLVYKIH